MSDSVRPHRRQPTRLPRPWDSPGKNTGVGCHFLLRCVKVKGESEVAQLCPTLSDPVDCSLPGSSFHGSFQARVLEGDAIAFFTGRPSTLQFMGSHSIGHEWSNLACMHACIGEGNGNPLQCSCLENPRDRGAWWAAVYGVAQNQTEAT